MPPNAELLEIGQRLRALREATGLDRDQFAGRLGISARTLKNAELGHQKLGARTMRDAERVAKQESSDWQRTADQFGRPGQTPSTPSPNTEVRSANGIPEAVIVKALAEARDPAVIRAAEALAEALGITADEALASVVARKLRQ